MTLAMTSAGAVRRMARSSCSSAVSWYNSTPRCTAAYAAELCTQPLLAKRAVAIRRSPPWM